MVLPASTDVFWETFLGAPPCQIIAGGAGLVQTEGSLAERGHSMTIDIT